MFLLLSPGGIDGAHQGVGVGAGNALVDVRPRDHVAPPVNPFGAGRCDALRGHGANGRPFVDRWQKADAPGGMAAVVDRLGGDTPSRHQAVVDLRPIGAELLEGAVQ